MPRTPRFVLEDVAHHVVARGVNRQRIFQSGFDKDKYLKRFARIAEEEKVLVHGYCLMDNHVHWLLTPTTPRGLARLFQRVHTWWAMVYNKKYDRTGHLFQNRYHSSPLSESHYWAALRYIELNPRRAGLTKKVAEWNFSSARAHLMSHPDTRIPLVRAQMRRRYSPQEWREFLMWTDIEREHDLRLAQGNSRPCGTPEWIRQLERHHGRKLAWSPPGRPTKATRALYAG